MKKKKIAIFTGPEGHYSIAKAIEQTLSKKYDVKIFYDRDFLFSFYTPFYQMIPAVNGLPFFISHKILSRNQKTTDLALDLFRFRYSKKIEKFISRHKPEAYLSTYFMYNPNLERFQNITNNPFIQIMSDPRTIHRLLISDQAKVNVAFDQQATIDAKKLSANAKIKNLGWFVRDEFEQEYDKKQVRKRLKLKNDHFTILIASGSEGTNMILKILPTILLTSKPIQVIVACGNNKSLFKAVKGLQHFASKRKKYQASLIPIAFTKDIHKYMQAADVVVGKAGPNTLFESIATLTPFFAITHIAGQEDGNLDIIREKELGLVEENPLKASVLLRDIIEDPSQLDKFSNGIKKIAQKNKQAKEKLIELVDKLINEKQN